jgi:threonine dehydrogenase-like Zn-dependent dehydrogenase
MKGAVLHGPRDVRFEERADPEIREPTDVIIRMSATCVCGSDLWPYRGIQPITEPTPMGHEYVGIVEEVGCDVRSIRPGQFVSRCCHSIRLRRATARWTSAAR